MFPNHCAMDKYVCYIDKYIRFDLENEHLVQFMCLDYSQPFIIDHSYFTLRTLFIIQNHLCDLPSILLKTGIY